MSDSTEWHATTAGTVTVSLAPIRSRPIPTIHHRGVLFTRIIAHLLATMATILRQWEVRGRALLAQTLSRQVPTIAGLAPSRTWPSVLGPVLKAVLKMA